MVKELKQPTEPGSVVLARYMGQGEFRRWVLAYPTETPTWVSGSTRCTWDSLTDQRRLLEAVDTKRQQAPGQEYGR